MKINRTIYLDHQSTTPIDAQVWDKMVPYFAELFGNPHSSDHCLGWYASQALEKAGVRVGELIGSDPNEIIFTSGATEANNLALLGVGRKAAKGKRKRILVSTIEHKCVLAVCRTLHEQLGYQVEYLRVDDEGFIDLSDLKEILNEDVLLVSIMAVNNEIGTIQDIEKISKIVRDYGTLLHCDAAQAPCALNIQHYAEIVDFISLSAHKIYGPKGIGALYIRHDLQEAVEPLIYGGGQQGALRSGTVPVPLCVGMEAASELLIGDEGENSRLVLRKLRDDFIKQLMNLPWPISLNGPKSHRHPGNANVCFKGFSAHEILNSLQPYVAASTGSACTSGMPEPSHVLRAIGLSWQEVEGSIRFSLGRGTTQRDLAEAVQLIGKTLSDLAEINSP